MLQLQERQVIGKAAVADPPGGQAPLQSLERHQQKPLEIELEFLRDRQGTMWAEIAVSLISKHHKPMIQRAVKHMLTHVAPMGWGQGHLHVALRQGGLHLSDAGISQFGMAVGAFALIGDPIGAQITFFKDMDAQAALAGQIDCFRMNAPGVAIKHDIGYCVRLAGPGKEFGPVLRRGRKGDILLSLAPEELVSRIEANAPDIAARLDKHFP